jgi:hypothetical protein
VGNGEKEAMKKHQPLVIIGIRDGRLQVRSSHSECVRSYLATQRGAKALGRWLYKHGYQEWLYSSSVDFPTEYGAQDLDFRSLAATAYADCMLEQSSTRTAKQERK